ncbi:aldo/keto reductase [Methylobacterium sp. Leaf117]|uniref:aldo/keto reductase n=1 Tax=Methylobacterium sp. Leaf117 TaxID=1736260 RepID=UPI0006F6BD13|nr:aldo/keto reductase [Methylobacterium sp. Leaf117]KQP96491.1 oxidoreductase [Methylobacterium sp. Leaf117]
MADATDIPAINLCDGRTIPQLGFGVYQLPDDRAPEIVGAAIRAGFRSIDTAAIYENEAGVGQAVRASVVSRSDLFVTTKLWNDRQGYEATLRAFDESLVRLGLDDVDLYLIHWPCPDRDLFLDTWKAFVRLQAEGRAKSIGVSNFEPDHLDRIITETGVVPAVNQIELHPRFQQKTLRAVHARYGIVTESWSPLGRGQALSDPILMGIAERHGRTPAQVVLRWQIQKGLVAIPKTATLSRIPENLDVFGFTLETDELTAIDTLDRPDGRMGPDPMTFG